MYILKFLIKQTEGFLAGTVSSIPNPDNSVWNITPAGLREANQIIRKMSQDATPNNVIRFTLEDLRDGVYAMIASGNMDTPLTDDDVPCNIFRAQDQTERAQSRAAKKKDLRRTYGSRNQPR